MNRPGDALPYLQRAKELRTKKNGADHPTVKDVEHVIEELTNRPKVEAKPGPSKPIDLDDVNVVTDKGMLKVRLLLLRSAS